MLSERFGRAGCPCPFTTAWALDCRAGEVFSERLVTNTDDVAAWVTRLPQLAAVAYEARTNGVVLACALETAASAA